MIDYVPTNETIVIVVILNICIFNLMIDKLCFTIAL